MARKYAEASFEDCSICFNPCASVKKLLCGHELCAQCLEKILDANSDVRCPNCRVVQRANQVSNRVCGRLECYDCLKMKDPEEFWWCSDCIKLLCCRCLTKKAHFDLGHRLEEWTSGLLVRKCLKDMTTRKQKTEAWNSLGKEQKKREILQLFLPVAEKIVQKLEEDQVLVDAVAELSIRANFQAVQESEELFAEADGGNYEEVLKIISKLSGIAPPGQLKIPGSLAVSDQLFNQVYSSLQFENAWAPRVAAKSFQTDDSAKKTNKTLATVDYFRFCGMAHEKQPLYVGKLLQWREPVRRAVFGELNGFAVLFNTFLNYFVIDLEGKTTDFIGQFRQDTTKFTVKDAAVWDSRKTVYILCNGPDSWEVQFWLFPGTEGTKFGHHIGSISIGSSGMLSGSLSCTETGVPYLFLNLKRADGQVSSHLNQFKYGRGSEIYSEINAVASNSSFIGIVSGTVRRSAAIGTGRKRHRIFAGNTEGIVYIFEKHNVNFSLVAKVTSPWKVGNIAAWASGFVLISGETDEIVKYNLNGGGAAKFGTPREIQNLNAIGYLKGNFYGLSMDPVFQLGSIFKFTQT